MCGPEQLQNACDYRDGEKRDGLVEEATVWYIVKNGVYLVDKTYHVVMVGDGVGEAYSESKTREFKSQEEAAEWLATSEFADLNAEVTDVPPTRKASDADSETFHEYLLRG